MIHTALVSSSWHLPKNGVGNVVNRKDVVLSLRKCISQQKREETDTKELILQELILQLLNYELQNVLWKCRVP